MKPLHTYSILWLLILTSLLACSAAKTARLYYIGTVGKSAVQMDLTFSGRKITGKYWYENSAEFYDAQGLERNDLSLAGVLGDNGQITLNEGDGTGKKTGQFTGTLTADRLHFAGAWRKNSLASPIPFSVKAVVCYATLALDDAKRNIHATATYPQLLEPGLPNGDFAAYMTATCNAAMNTFRAECLDGGIYTDATQGCTQDYTVVVAYYGPHFVSLLTEDYQDTWGVHPNTVLIAKNILFSSRTFEVMSLDSVFNDDAIDVLSHVVVAELKQLKKARNLEYDPTVFKLDPKFASNLLLFPKGAVFVFSRYDVGAYAEGEYYVTIPYSKLTGVLNFANTDLPVFVKAMNPKQQ